MAFTEEETGRIGHHLGYPLAVQLQASISLGLPSASQPMFLLYDALKRLTPVGEQNVRRDLCELESIECQMSEMRSRLKVSSVGEVTMRSDEFQQLVTHYVYWQRKLSDELGVVANPFSQMEWFGFPGGGVNSKVIG